MLNRTFFIGRTILAATILLVLSACVMGVPILSPTDISLLGAGAADDPLTWPYETNPQTLELECGGERIVIDVSTAKARVTLSDSTGELERDFSTRTKFRYFRMTRLTQDEHELIVTEGGLDEFKTDWLVLHSDGAAELKYEDISNSCRIERQ
jgi:hypothetical protein